MFVVFLPTYYQHINLRKVVRLHFYHTWTKQGPLVTLTLNLSWEAKETGARWQASIHGESATQPTQGKKNKKGHNLVTLLPSKLSNPVCFKGTAHNFNCYTLQEGKICILILGRTATLTKHRSSYRSTQAGHWTRGFVFSGQSIWTILRCFLCTLMEFE